MVVQAAIDDALPELRREAEARMQDMFEFRQPSEGGGYTFDPVLKEDVPAYTVLFTAKGYVGADKNTPREVEVGGRTLVTTGRGLRIPWDSPEVPSGTQAVCTAIGPLTPPRMLADSFVVAGSEDGSQKVYLNLAITEAT